MFASDFYGLLYLESKVNFRDIKPRLEKAWSDYMETGRLEPKLVRPVVSEAWRRCRERGVDPYRKAAPERNEAGKGQDDNPFDIVSISFPYFQKLGEMLRGLRCVAALCDHKGIILKIAGDTAIHPVLEEINFKEGYSFAENTIGNNGIGTCLTLGGPVQIISGEHFCLGGHNFICTGVPIRDPFASKILGVLDISGPVNDNHRHAYGLLLETVRQIEWSIFTRHCKQEYWLCKEALKDIGQLKSQDFIITDNKGTVRTFSEGAKPLLENNSMGNNLDLLFPVFHVLQSPDTDPEEVLEEIVDREGRSTLVRIKSIRHEGIRLGYLVAVDDPDRLKVKAWKRKGGRNGFSSPVLIGQSLVLQKALERALRVAPFDSTVLLTGESGTGKELFARLIHLNSPRSAGHFLAVNCAVIPSELLASELFGYEKGAFTGAQKEGRIGKFEYCHQGTIFLDEVSEIPLDIQIYLNRFIQEREILRVGSNRRISLDVRIIAAANKPLEKEVEQGRFREDLYYRLKVITISLPPLRERPDDIFLLADYFIKQISARTRNPLKRLDPATIEALKLYSWPGNIREMKNVMEYAFIMSQGESIAPSDLPEDISASSMKPSSHKPQESVHNQNVIFKALMENNWNVSRAARSMGVSRATMYRLLKRHGLMIQKQVSQA